MDLFTANKLTTLRKNAGFSQEALAEKIGVSRQAISKWERGEASPDTYNLQTLAKLYNVSLDDLLGEKKADEIIDNMAQDENAGSPEEDDSGFTAKQKAKISEAKKRYEKRESGKPEKLNAALTKKMLRLPFPFFVIIVFLAMGFAAKWWHPGWMVFLTIPMYYMIAFAFSARSKRGFLCRLPIPFIALSVYLLGGFLGSMWHPYWIILLIIPMYYWAICFFVKKDKAEKTD